MTSPRTTCRKQTKILQDDPDGDGDGTDEGRAKAQLVHDLAPGAAIDFATANGGEVNFAQNIQALAKPARNVIADDVRYPLEPYFQDGVVAQAVNTIEAARYSLLFIGWQFR